MCFHTCQQQDSSTKDQDDKAESSSATSSKQPEELATTLGSSQTKLRAWSEVTITSDTSVTTSPRHGDTVFQVRLNDSEFMYLKAESVDDMNGWLFDIHKAIILVTVAAQRAEAKMPPKERVAIFKPEKSYTHSRMTTGVSDESSSIMFQLAAVAAAEGRRDGMEDRHVILTNLRDDLNLDINCAEMAFFGVYDGHGGTAAADYLADHLHHLLAQQPTFPTDIPSAMKAAFKECDQAFLQIALQQDMRDGTTAIAAIIHRDVLHVANCGDCRGVLSANGEAVALSEDHRPNRNDEKDRIEAAGGWIVSREVLNVPMLYRLGLEDDDDISDDELEAKCGLVTVSRVNGVLSMTRSLGDLLIKDKREETFGCEFQGDIITADADIVSRQLQRTDEFMVLACDGLWDVESNQEVVDFVRKQLADGLSPQQAADALISQAIDHGSLDNVTVVVVILNGFSGEI
eukprot:TRINITY_DN18818_c0_g1_i1.p1 TRINITY_DN18818_c0_g1~~TRINITY_DN18818_c0_g1_i1.p1  ORF type:complete len:459 (+),score=97.61 TRINITY_DN18818_c0_g1_i1:198-1574(+)